MVCIECCVCGMQRALWSMQYAVWYVQCGMCSRVSAVWNVQCGMCSVVWSVWYGQCGKCSVVWSVWYDQCGMCSVVCAVWYVQCGMCSVVWSVWYVQCGQHIFLKVWMDGFPLACLFHSHYDNLRCNQPGRHIDLYPVGAPVEISSILYSFAVRDIRPFWWYLQGWYARQADSW